MLVDLIGVMRQDPSKNELGQFGCVGENELCGRASSIGERMGTLERIGLTPSSAQDFRDLGISGPCVEILSARPYGDALCGRAGSILLTVKHAIRPRGRGCRRLRSLASSVCLGPGKAAGWHHERDASPLFIESSVGGTAGKRGAAKRSFC
jgi:hypothetical protein